MMIRGAPTLSERKIEVSAKINKDILDYEATKPSEGGASFTLRNRLIRFVWNVVWYLCAAWTPPFMHGWRRFLLISFGAKMGQKTDVRGSARIWYPPLLDLGDGALLAERVICYNQAKITLGKSALVSQGAHLCAGSHDIDSPTFQLEAKPIYIGAYAWIAADAFVGPGVRVGKRAVLGARGVTFSDLEAGMVYVGNPARQTRSRKFYRELK